MSSFVYIWSNISTNQKYIGVHKGTPDDGYICSSKTMLEDYHKNSNIFERTIVAYGTFDEMYELESKMLREVDAAKNPQYYNQSNNNGKFYMTRMPESGKEKLRQKALGRPSPTKGISNPEQRERFLKNNPMKNPEIAAKVAAKLKGRPSPFRGIKYKLPKPVRYGKDGRKKTIWFFPDGRVILVEDTRKMCEQLGLSYSAVRHKIGKGPYQQGAHKGLCIDRYNSQEPDTQANS
jgi:hypothetical protein